MAKLAYLNGEILPIEKAFVPIEDRGYQFGDAVYEYIDSFEGRPFCLEAHLDRLECSLAGLQFAPVSRETVYEAVLALVKRVDFRRAGIYIQISRGVQARSHAYGEDLDPQIVMTIEDIQNAIPPAHEDGIRVRTCKDYRWGRCDIKTVQLLPAALEKRHAEDEGFDDTIFVSAQGTVREATSANLFTVMKGKLRTHPLDEHVLPGITRAVVLDLCRELGLDFDEDYFNLDELNTADEAFITSTVQHILPVISVDGHTIANGEKGSITKVLQDAFRKRVQHSG
jgi:D-alanine transaminase